MESERAALIFKASVAALIELESMKAANRERDGKGMADAYGEDAFLSLQNRLEDRVAKLFV